MAIKATNTDSKDFNSAVASGGPGKDERLDWIDDKGNIVASLFSDADGTMRFEINGVPVLTNAESLSLGATSVILSALPTEDPLIEGQLWNSTGTLKVSAGA